MNIYIKAKELEVIIKGAAAVAIGTTFLFQQRRKNQECSPIMTFRELYEDNETAEVTI